VLHPASVDASFHGLFDFVTEGDENTKTWLPIRFERMTVWEPGAQIVDVTIVVDKSGEQLKTVTLWMRDNAGRTVARLDHALLRAVARLEKPELQGVYHLSTPPAGLAAAPSLAALAQGWLETTALPGQSDGWLLLHAHMRAAGVEALRAMADRQGISIWPPCSIRRPWRPRAGARLNSMAGSAISCSISSMAAMSSSRATA
jgi:hypothetical protein